MLEVNFYFSVACFVLIETLFFIEIYLGKYLRQAKIFSIFAVVKMQGRLAQLVQSVCLTSRGSAVRIRQRPQS